MEHTDSRLVLRDIPVFMWLFGLVFAGVGTLIIIGGEGALPIGLIFAVFGLCALLFASVLTITADRNTRTLRLKYRSVLLHSLKEIAFDEIAAINVEHSTSRKGNTFRVVVNRTDGTSVPLHKYYSSGLARKEHQACRLRDFIGTRASAVTPAAPEIGETDGVRWQIESMAFRRSAVTRWCSSDFKIQDVFLFVAQKAEGQASGGILASLGSMMFRQSIQMHGFRPDDTPGLEQSGLLAPLDPALEPHFMAYTNAPDSARRILNSGIVKPLAEWAGRYPLKQFQRKARFSQLVLLIGPNGVCLATASQLQPDQANELATLGVELVKALGGGSRRP